MTPCAKAVDAAVVSLDARGADSAGLPALGRLAHKLNLAELHADYPSTSSAAQLGLHQVLEHCTSGGGGVQGCKGRACVRDGWIRGGRAGAGPAFHPSPTV